MSDLKELRNLVRNVFINTFRPKGLKHELTDLQNIFPEIVNYPVDKQAEYADHICKSLASDTEFLQEQLYFDYPEAQLAEVANATTIGNLAYLELNAPYPYNSRANDLLHFIKETLKTKDND